MRVFRNRPWFYTVTIETMTSMQHKFGALDLIRAGLQDLDKARTLFDELHNDGIDDDRMRLLLTTLEKACDPDVALSNLVGEISNSLSINFVDSHQLSLGLHSQNRHKKHI